MTKHKPQIPRNNPPLDGGTDSSHTDYWNDKGDKILDNFFQIGEEKHVSDLKAKIHAQIELAEKRGVLDGLNWVNRELCLQKEFVIPLHNQIEKLETELENLS